MPSFEHEGTVVTVDEEGYLVDFEAWNEKVACALAEREGVSKECPLPSEMMDIMKFMREYYVRYHSFPVVRAVCRKVHQSPQCTYEQFPDPIKAWKIAGLPKPTTEVFALIQH